MQTVKEYMENSAPEWRDSLEKIRDVIKSVRPDAAECIKWGMPTISLGKKQIHFALQKKHIGLYPGPEAVQAFQNRLTGLKTSKGAVQFPLGKPVPFELIKEIAEFVFGNSAPKKKQTPSHSMTAEKVLEELEKLGTQQTKKTYLRHDAREPLFGVATGALKPLKKQIGLDQTLAMQLYATGNYDAMYFAGMIADPDAMTRDEFELWMEGAYCAPLAEYVVAVTLAETDFAQQLADEWIARPEDLYRSAGYSCYCWLLGTRPDGEFDKQKILRMLRRIEQTIHGQANRTKYAMNQFVISVGISYLPLHSEAVKTALKLGEINVDMGPTSCKTPPASDYIERAKGKGRIGFKRKNVRC